MNLKDFKVQSEAEDSYHLIHPSGKSFTVDKKSLNDRALKAIQGLSCGGPVQKMSGGGTSGVPLMLAPNDAPAAADPVASPADMTNNALTASPAQAFPTPTPEQVYQQRLAGEMQNIDQYAKINPGDPTVDIRRKAAPALVMQSMEADQQKSQNANQMQSQDIAQTNAQRARVGLAPLPNPGASAQPQNQSSASAPAAAAAMPNQMDPFEMRGNQVEDALNKQQKDIQSFVGGIGKLGGDQQRAYQELIDKQAQMKTPDQIMAEHKAKDDELLQHFMEAKVDPNRYMNNMSTGSKILAGIGAALAGMGGGASGKNLALENIQRAIDHDIDSQKNEQGKRMTLWKMNRDQTKDETQANIMTQNQLLTGVQAKIAMAGSATQNMEARLRGTEMINQIEQQKAQNRFQLGMLGAGAGGGGRDPAQLVSTLVPKEHQAKVFEEIGRADNVGRNGDKIAQAFEQASKENTVAKTGAGYLRTPGSVMALHQLLLPNFKQIDGTVRQAAMDETFHNVTPQPGDSEYTIQYKRRALQDWLHSETAAPTAKGFGIDLSRFRSTSADPVARMSPQEQTYYQWAKANPSSPVAIAFMRKKGLQ